MQIEHPIRRRLEPRQPKRLVEVVIIAVQIVHHCVGRLPTRMIVRIQSALTIFQDLAVGISVAIDQVRPRAALRTAAVALVVDVEHQTNVRVEHHFGTAVVISGGKILLKRFR